MARLMHNPSCTMPHSQLQLHGRALKPLSFQVLESRAGELKRFFSPDALFIPLARELARRNKQEQVL